jgi:hypothetical protein
VDREKEIRGTPIPEDVRNGAEKGEAVSHIRVRILKRIGPLHGPDIPSSLFGDTPVKGPLPVSTYHVGLSKRVGFISPLREDVAKRAKLTKRSVRRSVV